MKSIRSFTAVLFCGLMSYQAGVAQQVAQNSEVIIVPAGDSFLRWFAPEGRTFFIQVSDPNDHLRSWVWSEFIETGNDHQISHEIGTTADKAFFRLHYTDEQPPPGVSLEDWDPDGDGLSNALELYLQTNPLVADTSGDGIPDGWAYFHGLNPLDNNAAGMFQGGTTTNLEALQAGVQAHPAATLADHDGDFILNELDADPQERVIDWAPASHPAFAVIELDIDDVDDWTLDDFTAKGTVLLSRNQENAPFDRAVIDRDQVAHLFLYSNIPTVGAPFAGYGSTLFGEQVMGLRLVNESSLESLWDPLTNIFTEWQRPFGYDGDIEDERDGIYVAGNWLNLAPGSPQGLRLSPDGALLPGDDVTQSSNCRIEENGNIVSNKGYWRKDPISGTLGNVQPFPATPSAVRSATLVQGSPEVKWNLVAAHSGLMVSKDGGAFVQASGALKGVPVHGVTKQGWVVDTQQNRIRANGEWYPLTNILGDGDYDEADLLDIMDTGLGIAKIRRLGQPRRLVILLPIEITAAFGEGPDIPAGAVNLTSRELLENYLDEIKVARQGDFWAVNGKDEQGNDKIWGVEIVSEQAGLNAALASSDRYVIFDGHSNYGFGPDFLGPDNIERISDFTNYGVKYTDVPLTFRKLLRNPQNPNDPSNFGDPHGNLEIPDGEIADAPTNYKPLPIDKERFPNIDSVGIGQAFQQQGQGFDTWHYQIEGGSKRLMVHAPKTDLPVNLAYKTFFYNACSSGIDYIENFMYGDFIYTNQSCHVHKGTKIFVQGVIEGKATEGIIPLLNIPEVGGGGVGDVFYSFERF